MEKELAQHLAYILQHCSGLLDHTVWLMKRHGTEAEFLQHRDAVAQVLAELGIQLLYPIWREYPDLEPALPPSSGDQEEPSSEKSPQEENQLGKDVLMGKEIAQQFASIFQHCSGLLDHIVWLMKHHGAEAEFLRHRRAVAEVLTELRAKLLFPIYAEYPDLDPSPSTPKGEA
jgi:hypothetical protein